jgi:hypothetical protein
VGWDKSGGRESVKFWRNCLGCSTGGLVFWSGSLAWSSLKLEYRYESGLDLVSILRRSLRVARSI